MRAEWHIEAAAQGSGPNELGQQWTEEPCATGEVPWSAGAEGQPF